MAQVPEMVSVVALVVAPQRMEAALALVKDKDKVMAKVKALLLETVPALQVLAPVPAVALALDQALVVLALDKVTDSAKARVLELVLQRPSRPSLILLLLLRMLPTLQALLLLDPT